MVLPASSSLFEPPVQGGVRRWPISAGVGVIAALLHAAVTPAVPGTGDSPEFTLVLAVGGIPHPTGYPLYALLGHAWVLAVHALGASWGWAANAWSAAGAGVAAGLLHALARRAMDAAVPAPARTRDALAAVPAAVLVANRVWFLAASSAEVHTWHVALLAAVSLSAWRLLDAASEAGASRAAWACFGLACGAALAHHATALLFVAPIAVAVVARSPRHAAKQAAVVVAAALVPMASVAFVFWRAWHPAAYQWPLLEASTSSVLDHLGGRIFSAYLAPFSPSPEQRSLLATAIYPFVAATAVALGWAAWRARAVAARDLARALLAGSLLQVAFILVYGVPDPAAYFLPVLFAGLAGLAIALGEHDEFVRRPAVALPVAIALGLLLGGAWSAALERNDQLRAFDVRIRHRWNALPFDAGIVFWNSDGYVRLLSLQRLERSRPGVYVQNTAMLTWPAPRAAFRERFGFDPLEGLDLKSDADLSLIPGNVARRAGMPVADFALLPDPPAARTP